MNETVAGLMAEKERLAREAKAATSRANQQEKAMKEQLDAVTAEAEEAKAGLKAASAQRELARKALNVAG